VKKLRDDVLPKMDGVDEKGLGELVYAVASDCGIESKALFNATYQALINKDQGPRLASFMKIIGRERLAKILAVY
jgi:lysyl-tRNA synthetase class 1